jgi:hypothetical protein
MNRSELTLAIAAVLVLALLTGWVLHWLFARLNAGGRRNAGPEGEMAARLQVEEEARLVCERRLLEAEARYSQRLQEVQAELDSTHASLVQARAQAEEIRAAYRRSVMDQHKV